MKERKKRPTDETGQTITTNRKDRNTNWQRNTKWRQIRNLFKNVKKGTKQLIPF